MEIILLEKIINLGEIGDIVSVKEGYARNYLLPKGKVLRATNKNKEIFAAKRAMLEQQSLEKKQVAEEDAKKILGLYLNIIRQAGEDGRLYGSVLPKDIALAITTSHNVRLSAEQIIIKSKIKNIGLYNIEIALHADVKVPISLNVARNIQEAEATLKKISKQNLSDEKLQVQDNT